MDDKRLPTDIEACHRLLAEQRLLLAKQETALKIKSKLVEEQAHSVLELKHHNDKLQELNTELQLKVEKLLQQLFGRKSERRVDGEGQLLIDLGEEATPEVISALEEAVREAQEVVADAELREKQRRPQPPRKSDRKFLEHLPRYDRIVDLPEECREGLKFIGFHEVETQEWGRAELRVRLNKYA